MPKPTSNSEIAKAPNEIHTSVIASLPTNEDRQIYSAKMEGQNNPPFAELKEDAICKLINKASYFMGLREPLENEVLYMQANFLKRNFPNFNSATFTSAFNLAAAQKLNCDTEFYGNWTPHYMARILSAYENRAREVEIRARRTRAKIQEEQELKMRAEMFDLEVSLARLIYNACMDMDISREQDGTYNWIWVYQARGIGMMLRDRTNLQPDRFVAGGKWNGDDEQTIEMMRLIKNGIAKFVADNDLGDQITEEAVVKWLKQWTKKQER